MRTDIPFPKIGRLGLALSLFLTLTASNLHAADDRTLIFADDFQNRTDLGTNYVTALGGAEAWTITNGILIGKQTNLSHGAIIRKNLAFHNLDSEIDFRFNGGTRVNFVFDDAKEKSVHAGHICRVSISPKRLTISDDKTGKMNLAIQAQRDSKTLTSEQQQSLDKLLAIKEASAAVDLKTGAWQHLRVHLAGDTMTAYLNGQQVATLRSPGIDHPTKSKFGMTVIGEAIDFDNLKVYGPTN